MAIYTIQIKTVSRSSGHSATAKIAYNCRDKITDICSGEIHKYDSKKMSADLMHSEITYKDLSLDKKYRSEIWNNAELAENRKDSRTAREYVVALPKELSTEQNIELVREFAKELTIKYNNVADWAIHDGKDGNDNIHAHILTTTREFNPETKQLGERTSIEWNNTKCQKNNVPITQEQIKTIRKDWETIQNKHLAMAGLDLAVSCERKEDRDTVKKHLGKEAVALERQGLKTELGNYNRTIDNVLELDRQIYNDGSNLARERAELAKLERRQERERQQRMDEQLKELQLTAQREMAQRIEKLQLSIQRNLQELELRKDPKYAREAKEKQEIERLKTPAENNLSFDDSSYTPYKLFDIAREHQEFFTKQTVGNYEYWSSRDGAVEVHDKHINVNITRDETINLALDVAVSKFGSQLSLNGTDEFIDEVINQLAINQKYAEVSLNNPEHQEKLDSKRLDIEIENAVDLDFNSIDIDLDDVPNIDINRNKPLTQQAHEIKQELTPVEQVLREYEEIVPELIAKIRKDGFLRVSQIESLYIKHPKFEAWSATAEDIADALERKTGHKSEVVERLELNRDRGFGMEM